MKVFISHSSKDAEIAKCFSFFLKNLDMGVEVFCTSISGGISQGDDFVHCIEKELKNSDADSIASPFPKLPLEKSEWIVQREYTYLKDYF